MKKYTTCVTNVCVCSCRASSEKVELCAPPSDDHAYCLTEEMLQQHLSPESSIDEEYEFGANDK